MLNTVYMPFFIHRSRVMFPVELSWGLNETIIPLALANRSLRLAVVFFNLASSHPSALVSSHCSNESLLLSARSRAANSLSLNTLSSNPTADIGFRCALLPSFPCILHTKAELFNFLTLASGKCDGMRDRSQNKRAAAGNGRGLVLSALTGLSQQQVWPHWPREPHVRNQLQPCTSTGSFCCLQWSS